MVDNSDNTYGGKYVVNPRYSTYQCDSTIARCNAVFSMVDYAGKVASPVLLQLH